MLCSSILIIFGLSAVISKALLLQEWRDLNQGDSLPALGGADWTAEAGSRARDECRWSGRGSGRRLSRRAGAAWLDQKRESRIWAGLEELLRNCADSAHTWQF